jgi:AraC-like DNA-binding protein
MSIRLERKWAVQLRKKSSVKSVYRWEDALIVIKIIKGNFNFFSRTGNTVLRENDFVVINRGELYNIEGFTEDASYLELIVNKEYLMHHGIDDRRIVIVCHSGKYALRHKAKYTQLEELLNHLVESLECDEGVLIERERHLLFGQFIACLCYRFDFIASGVAKKMFSEKIVERNRHLFESAFIQTGAMYDKNLLQISSSLNLSYAHLRKDIAERYGHGFTWFKYRVMVEEATKQMIMSNDSITRIASHVGFSDTKYLIKNFRQHYGLTPSEFRNEYANKNYVGLQCDCHPMKTIYF